MRDVRMAGGLGEIGRCPAVGDGHRRIGAGGQEQLDHLDIAMLGGFMERRVAAVLGRIDIGPRREEDTAHLDVPSGAGRMEGLVREVVGRVRVDGRSGIDEETRDLWLAEERCEMEGREPVR